ncbi:MAG: holA [Ilumatobacteraceae bacterium]|nr:holA [Ilumatobacteraceae bacterium]MCU1390974.1 holA [Ilumatobacteraceae bacterium]
MALHLITGDDESLVHAAVTDLVHRLVGDGDRTLMVDDFGGEEFEVRAVVDAAQTMPFLTDKRVVVARDVGRFNAEDVAPLVAYLGDPLPSTDLVLVAGGGRLAKSLTDALKQAGGTTTNTTPPTSKKDRSTWIEEQVIAAGMKLEPGALAMLGGWMGEAAGRLAGVLDTLESTYGSTRKLSAADIEPFLGESGSVPPWDLTDAIDRGDTKTSLELLARMMQSRHPLVVMATLHSHYVKMMKVDGKDANSEAEVAAVLGIKPGFPARKVLDQYRRLGGGGVTRAISLLANADLDLRGQRDLPETLVMEVLVARLSRLAPAMSSARRR